MHQARCRLGLALEARHERGVLGEVLGEQLHRNPALQALVEGAVNGGHAAEAQAPFQAVARADLSRVHLGSPEGAAPPAAPSLLWSPLWSCLASSPSPSSLG